MKLTLEQRIRNVRLAAGNNQFDIALCGDLAGICVLAISADEWRFRSADLERQVTAEQEIRLEFERSCEVIAESHKWCSIRLEKAEAALREIAKQKILDEVEDSVCCDFEDGYTQCVEVARAAISAENV
jgi:hypothetical protein